jgi:hypothetical protein
MGFFGNIKNWFGRTFGTKENTIQDFPKKELEIIKQEDFQEENIPEEIQKIPQEIDEQSTFPEIKKNILKKERLELVGERTTKEEIQEGIKLIQNKEIRTKTFGSLEGLRNNKYDIYRNIIMGAIKDDRVVESIYRGKVLDQNIVGSLHIMGTIQDAKTKIRRSFDEIVQIARFTPDMAMDKGLFDFNNYEGELDDFRKEFRTRFHGIGMSFIGEKGQNNSGDILRIDKIEVWFDFK